ncbi:MAG: hypothetical protein AB8H80_13770 [Planctomycetota bacterium]
MGLIELCLLSLISPQEPVTGSASTKPAPAQPVVVEILPQAGQAAAGKPQDPAPAKASQEQPATPAEPVAVDPTPVDPAAVDPAVVDPAGATPAAEPPSAEPTQAPAAPDQPTATPAQPIVEIEAVDPDASDPAATAAGEGAVADDGDANAEGLAASSPAEDLPELRDPETMLQEAEEAFAEADPAILVALTACDNAHVATRAAWLLGQTGNPEHTAALPIIAQRSLHADARVQALSAYRKHADQTAMPLAIKLLEDDDRRVRTLAAQLLGKHPRPASVEPLLGLIRSQREIPADAAGAATDVEAALLTLTDLGAANQLVRMATEVDDGNVRSAGEALAYAFSILSPRLSEDREATTLLAVLDHKELLLRRYAITRLTQLGNPTALSAMEARLAKESDELRPLLEVAVTQLRHDSGAYADDEVGRASANAKVLWSRTQKRWEGMSLLQKVLVGATPVVLIVLILLIRGFSKRRSLSQDAIATAALVAPSDAYAEDGDEYESDEDEEGYEDGDDYELEDDDEAETEYDDDEEYEDSEYEEFDGDEDEEEGDSDFQDDDYDASAWDEDEEGDESVLADGGLEQDERFR